VQRHVVSGLHIPAIARARTQSGGNVEGAGSVRAVARLVTGVELRRDAASAAVDVIREIAAVRLAERVVELPPGGVYPIGPTELQSRQRHVRLAVRRLKQLRLQRPWIQEEGNRVTGALAVAELVPVVARRFGEINVLV